MQPTIWKPPIELSKQEEQVVGRIRRAKLFVFLRNLRHVLHDLDTGLIRAVGITPANVPEASVTRDISADLERQQVMWKELHIDRAYLSSHLVRGRSDELEIYCKAWPVREGKHFSKQIFLLDWDRQIIRCPAEQEMPFVPGGVVHFPKDTCAQCPLKTRCTTSAKGRSVSIHQDKKPGLHLDEHPLLAA